MSDELKDLTKEELSQVPAGLKACYNRACESVAQCVSSISPTSHEARLADQLKGSLILRCRAAILQMQERTTVVPAVAK